MEQNHWKGVKGTVWSWHGVVWCGTVWHEAWWGKARQGKRGGKIERNCGSIHMWHAWLCLAVRACIGSRLARSCVKCGSGVVWVRFCVDMVVVAVRTRAHFGLELEAWRCAWSMCQPISKPSAWSYVTVCASTKVGHIYANNMLHLILGRANVYLLLPSTYSSVP